MSKRFWLTAVLLLFMPLNSASAELFQGVSTSLAGEGMGLSSAQATSGLVALSYYSQQQNKLIYSELGPQGPSSETVFEGGVQDTVLVFGDTSHIFFVDGTARLKHAWRAASGWSSEQISASAQGEISATRCGASVCVAYYDTAAQSLTVGRKENAGWTLHSVAPGASRRSAIAALPDGRIIIAFTDANTSSLKLAREVATNNWQTETVSQDAGLNPSLVVDTAGSIHLASSSFLQDSLNWDYALHYALWKDGSWSRAIVSDDYAGGKPVLQIVRGEVVLTHRYRRKNAYAGDALGFQFRRLSANGIWELRKHFVLPSPEGALDEVFFFPTAAENELVFLLSTESNQGDPQTRQVLHRYASSLPSDDDNSDDEGDNEPDDSGDPLADDDGDGVSNGQELVDGTNPHDAASVLAVLSQTICAEWNGFFRKFWNIFEHVNQGNRTLRVRSVLYSIEGQPVDEYHFEVRPGAQVDALVHGFQGRVGQSYGKICSTHDGAPGELDGRMVYYKESQDTPTFDFAFAMPVQAGRAGEQWLGYNTFYPGNETERLVANWIQISNLESSEVAGDLIFYDIAGEEQARQAVSLPAAARRDFSGHQFGVNKVGTILWKPHQSNTRVQMRNVRYLYANDGSSEDFETAFQVEALSATGERTSVPFDISSNQMSVVEIGSASSNAAITLLQVFNEHGSLLAETKIALRAFESRHVLLHELVPLGTKGQVVLSPESGKVFSVVMQYVYAEQGALSYMYGVAAVPALGTVLKTSYNTWLGQRSKLILRNITNQAQVVQMSLVRNSGEAVRFASHEAEALVLPAQGSREIDITETVGFDDYGVITINTENSHTISGVLLRERAGEYSIPIPLRQ